MDRIFPIDGFACAKRVLALVGCTVALASLALVPAAAQEPTDAQSGFSSAEEAVNGWMNSAGHRETLLRPTLREIGIAIEYNANTDFGAYWTADFGRREG
jgi:Cysteine-rich secretory protein family